MRVTFWGAAQTVTGSMHHIEAAGKRFLLDCGLYQGRRRDAFERNSHFPFPVSSIDGVILSHAHIDHSGNLPTLVHSGYSGPIYTTPATVDLCLPMLADSAYLQQKDVEFCNRRREHRRALGRDDRECEPLYLPEDAEHVNPLFCPVELGQIREVAPGFRYRTYEAGHMLGATSMIIEADGVRLAFSGDVGRKHLPILRDPVSPDPVDYLIMESTYGDRFHKAVADVAETLAGVVNRTAGRGGKIIVPCFAVGRTQQLVMVLHQLMDAHRIPSIPIFVDSPLAVNATEVFRKHPECYDEKTFRAFTSQGDPFAARYIRYVSSVQESMKLNRLKGPCMIIAASGMCEGGRILHHLKHALQDEANIIAIVGFQAEHTLGRKLVEGWDQVPIFGVPTPRRAQVVRFNGLSAHADRNGLLAYVRAIKPAPARVFVVHGEEKQSLSLAAAIQAEHAGMEVIVPEPDSTHEL